MEKEKAMEAGKAFKVFCLFVLWGALIALTWIASTPAPRPPAQTAGAASATDVKTP